MLSCLCTALSTSRRTCGERLLLAENTRIMMRAAAIASMISEAQSAEGAMSRGAIQQEMPCASSLARSSNAQSRSGWE